MGQESRSQSAGIVMHRHCFYESARASIRTEGAVVRRWSSRTLRIRVLLAALGKRVGDEWRSAVHPTDARFSTSKTLRTRNFKDRERADRVGPDSPLTPDPSPRRGEERKCAQRAVVLWCNRASIIFPLPVSPALSDSPSDSNSPSFFREGRVLPCQRHPILRRLLHALPVVGCSRA